MQAVVTAALFHAAVAQVPFKLVCPGAGFIERHDYTLECTVRGSDVTSASCIAPVSLIRLETVDAGVPKSIAHSPFPTCENNWSSVDNNNGRCADRDTNTDVYTYQFNVTADRAILTNLTGLRCFAECSGGPGVGNPFTFNTSKSCGPPVIFAEIPDADKDTTSDCEAICIGGLSVVGTIFVAGGAAAVVLWPKKIKVYVGYRREQIKRIDDYADSLDRLKSNLKKILEKKITLRVTFKVIIDGNRAKQRDGSRKDDKDHLHVLVQFSKIINHDMSMEIVSAVNTFVKSKVRPNLSRDVIVLSNATFPRTDDSGKEWLPSKNENQEYVIQVEGATKKAVEDEERKVKEQLHNADFDRTILVQEDIRNEVLEYIEETTGTTIVPLTELGKRSIRIEGSNEMYTGKAKEMVENILKKELMIVPVPENTPIPAEKLITIKKELSPKEGRCTCGWSWCCCVSKTTTINLKLVENGREGYVVTIEGTDEKQCDKAAKKVKALFTDDAPPSRIV